MKQWIKDLFSGAAAVKQVRLSRYFVTGFLLFVFTLAYVITDYWNLFVSVALKDMFLALTLFLAVAWSLLGSGSLRIHTYKNEWLTFLLIAAMVLALNYFPLNSDIPWRGDEDYHIHETLELFSKVPWFVYVAYLAAWVVILSLAKRKPRWSVVGGGLLTAGALVFYPFSKMFANVRYPFVSYWAYILPLQFFGEIEGPYQEILFRIFPLLSVAALAWLFQRSLAPESLGVKMFWAFAIAVIPVVYYYSSVLYLEMPAVFFMTLACLNAETLLTKSFSEVKQNAGWYGLILAGFIKETILPFTLAFIAFRLSFSIKRWIKGDAFQADANEYVIPVKSDRLRNLIDEISYLFVSLLPILYYLSFRNAFSTKRTYSINLANLFNNFSDYVVLVRSFIEQFGLFLLLFIGGCVILFLKKKKSIALLYVALVAGYSVFFHIDQEQYLGYSRFNLMILPAVLAGAAVFVKEVLLKPRVYGVLLAAIAIGSSLLLSPIQRDGTKTPYWGNYLTDTSEHYFPVEEAITYLMNGPNPNGSTLFAGLDYKYDYHFYQEKLNWRPDRVMLLKTAEGSRDDESNLHQALNVAWEEGFEFVFLFVHGDAPPTLPGGSVYREMKVVSNMSHTIVIYSRR